jgi:hypothetical protein
VRDREGPLPALICGSGWTPRMAITAACRVRTFVRGDRLCRAAIQTGQRPFYFCPEMYAIYCEALYISPSALK